MLDASSLVNKLSIATNEIHRLQQRNDEMDAKVRALRRTIDIADADAARYFKELEAAKKELKTLRDQIEAAGTIPELAPRRIQP